MKYFDGGLFVFITAFIIIHRITNVFSLPCDLRESKYGLVCVCNVTYCDTLDVPNPNGINEFILVSTSKGGLRYSVTKGNFSINGEKLLIDDYRRSVAEVNPMIAPSVIGTVDRFLTFLDRAEKASPIQITVNQDVTFQKIVGFGGAITGAVSYNLDILTKELRDHVYNSYFSETEGIAYNILRISIGGCDFDLEPWAYNEEPINDIELTHFTKLDTRDDHKLEQINHLKSLTNKYNIKIIGAAWSPPKWMKSNNAWTGISELKTEFYDAWARYHLKFLELMSAKNMSLWAISTGNEPSNGGILGALFVKFMSLGWTSKNQARWVAENLGPLLRNSSFKDVKLFSPDDQRYLIPSWLNQMEKAIPDSTNYLDGAAVHWYWDDIFGPYLLDQLHEKYPNKLILNTESCVGDKPWETNGPELGSWDRAEKYIKSYLEDLLHWVNGWIDWNLILNEKGGPNYVDNYVDAPVIINATTGTEIYKQPMFYAIGHFSRFFVENSIRISTKSADSSVQTVAFKRPDNTIALILFNSKSSDVDLKITDTKRGDAIIRIPKKSVHTLVYNA